MKSFRIVTIAVFVFSACTTLVAASIALNNQKALAYRIDDHTPRPYPADSPRTHTG